MAKSLKWPPRSPCPSHLYSPTRTPVRSCFLLSHHAPSAGQAPSPGLLHSYSWAWSVPPPDASLLLLSRCPKVNLQEASLITLFKPSISITSCSILLTTDHFRTCCVIYSVSSDRKAGSVRTVIVSVLFTTVALNKIFQVNE